MNLDRREIGHDQERRVLQRVLVVDELAQGGVQIATLALVLQGEEAALPNVGEPVATAELPGPLLERVPRAGGVGVGGTGLAEHAAQVEEVALGGGPLPRLDPAPLGGELPRRHCS
jgi:hypothetical protein